MTGQNTRPAVTKEMPFDYLKFVEKFNGKLSNEQARLWYNEQLAYLDTSGPLTRETAERVNASRNELKQLSRNLMADRQAAALLDVERPLLSLDYYIDKYSAQQFSGTSLWEKIINSSTTPNSSVNRKYGIKE
jgi:hypothetical protein